RFDTQPVARSATPPSPATAPAPATEPDAEAERFVTEVVRDHGVVMFALEWCEFCWAARKLFGQLDIAYRSVDIDSAALQTDDMGTRIRAVLRQRTGSPTIPQIYVGGRHVGGCTDLFDAMRSGGLRRLLDDAGIPYRQDAQVDPYTLLPKWLHPRRTA